MVRDLSVKNLMMLSRHSNDDECIDSLKYACACAVRIVNCVVYECCFMTYCRQCGGVVDEPASRKENGS